MPPADGPHRTGCMHRSSRRHGWSADNTFSSITNRTASGRGPEQARPVEQAGLPRLTFPHPKTPAFFPLTRASTKSPRHLWPGPICPPTFSCSLGPRIIQKSTCARGRGSRGRQPGPGMAPHPNTLSFIPSPSATRCLDTGPSCCLAAASASCPAVDMPLEGESGNLTWRFEVAHDRCHLSAAAPHAAANLPGAFPDHLRVVPRRHKV